MTPQEEFYDKLRIDYNEYLDNLHTMPPQQIIEKAYETVTKESILTCFEGRKYLTETEAMALLEKDYGLNDFYSDWLDADTHYEDAVRDCVNARIAMLQQEYLLQDPTLRRFMGVDLIDFLSKVAKKVVVHYPGDISTDKKQLLKIAATPEEWDKRLAYHCCSWGTHIVDESEMFIKDTFAFNCWTGYRERDRDMLGYIIEITDFRDGTVIGNAYSVGDYYSHVLHVRETALVLDSVTLTYTNEWGANAGKTITVPRYEYDRDRHYLMSDSGDVMSIKHHPSESFREMSELLQHEQTKRLLLPIGNIHEHLQRIDEIVAEVRDVPEPPKRIMITTQPVKRAVPLHPEKPQTFEELLKSSQAKADEINSQNAVNKQPKDKTNNIYMEAI